VRILISKSHLVSKSTPRYSSMLSKTQLEKDFRCRVRISQTCVENRDRDDGDGRVFGSVDCLGTALAPFTTEQHAARPKRASSRILYGQNFAGAKRADETGDDHLG
jgi:hypothetical protein